MKTAKGHITVLQEHRFRLTTDGGQSLLFTLAPGIVDVNQFRLAHTPVFVEYKGEPGLASAVAYRVNPTN